MTCFLEEWRHRGPSPFFSPCWFSSPCWFPLPLMPSGLDLTSAQFLVNLSMVGCVMWRNSQRSVNLLKLTTPMAVVYVLRHLPAWVVVHRVDRRREDAVGRCLDLEVLRHDLPQHGVFVPALAVPTSEHGTEHLVPHLRRRREAIDEPREEEELARGILGQRFRGIVGHFEAITPHKTTLIKKWPPLEGFPISCKGSFYNCRIYFTPYKRPPNEGQL